MKNLIKPMILIILAVILAILVSVPHELTAISYYPGIKAKINGIDTCMCPMWSFNCQCGYLEPPGF